MHPSVFFALCYAFFPFVLGCFGGIGYQAARFLCALAFLELRQHDAIRERAGLALLSPSDRSQFRARCFDRRLREYLRLWPKLLSCVLLELRCYLPLPTFLIDFVLPIAPALLIFFHDAVNSFLPLPSLHPPMPPLFPLIFSFPAFSVDLDCAS